MYLYHSTTEANYQKIERSRLIKSSRTFDYFGYVDSLLAVNVLENSGKYLFKYQGVKAGHLGNGAYFYASKADAENHKIGNVVLTVQYDDTGKTFNDFDNEDTLDNLIEFLDNDYPRWIEDTFKDPGDAEYRRKYNTFIKVLLLFILEQEEGYELFLGTAIEMYVYQKNTPINVVAYTYPVAVGNSIFEKRRVVAVRSPKKSDFINISVSK